MKKILVINTLYKEKGGEDTNIIDEVEFLNHFYDVKYIEYSNREKLNIFDFLSFLTNSNYKSNRVLSKALDEFSPDIAYVHNTWFKANLGIFKILNKRKVKTYIKVHNFRYYCTNFFKIKNHIKEGKFCFKCNLHLDGRRFNKYYENSFIKSFFGIIYGKRYFSLIKNSKINLIVMTDFHKKYLEGLGFDSNKINIYRNPIKNLSENKYNQDSECIVYAGRISQDKGIEELIKAWIESGIENLSLKIIGQGPLLLELSKKYKYPSIEFLGPQTHEITLEIIRESRGVVTATKMYEGQPRLLCEASICGIPSLFPDFGGMGEFFPNDYKLKFNQFDYVDLADKLKIFEEKALLVQINKNLKLHINNMLSEKTMKESFEELLH